MQQEGTEPYWRKPFKDIKAWLAQRGVILQVPRSLQQAVLRPQISPVIFIGAEPQYPLAFSGKPKIRRNDREDAFFRHQPKDSGRDDVDAAKS